MNRGRVIGGFIGLAIAMFMGTLDATIINIALPAITDYFHASVNDTSWISTIYVLVLSVTIITTSKLADQFGRKKVMLIGIILFGGSSALCGASHTLLMLIVMRGIQALGGAILMSIAIPMSINLLGKERMSIASSLMGAITALAAASGPPLGGMLLAVYHWQSVFFVNVPFAAIAFVLILCCTGESFDETISKRIDGLGMLLLSAALFLLTFALLKGNDYGWQSPLIIIMYAGAAVSTALFVAVEQHVRAPMVEFHLFREWTFTASALSYLTAGFGIIATSMMMSYFLQNLVGWTPLRAAYVIMTISLCVVVAMPLGSRIMEHTGARPLIFAGIVLMGIGLLMMAHLRVASPASAMVTDLIVYGAGFGLDTLAIITAIKYLPPEKSGVASGVVNAARYVGTCLAIALLVSILDRSLEDAKTAVQTEGTARIQQAALSPAVKTVAERDIRRLLAASDSGEQQTLQKQMTHDMTRVLKQTDHVPRPGTGTTRKVYDGSSALSEGAAKVARGQDQLAHGLDQLNGGAGRLADGSAALSTGMRQLGSSAAAASAGAGKFAEASSSGLSALMAGTGQLSDSAGKLAAAADSALPSLRSGATALNAGAQQLLKQFSVGMAGGSTVYDGVNKVAGGAGQLVAMAGSYTSMVNALLYTMIADDPDAPALLGDYEAQLGAAQAALQSDAPAAQVDDAQRVAAFGNLVALYRAAADPSVHDTASFAAALSENPVVSSGAQLTASAAQLSAASTAVAGQFADSGAFKHAANQLAVGVSSLAANDTAFADLQSGTDQLARGAAQLNASSGALPALQQGSTRLAQALSALPDGVQQLSAGADALQSGSAAAASGTQRLRTAAAQLGEAGSQVSGGAARLAQGVALSAQAVEARRTLSSVESLKNNRFADAFDFNFLIAGLILLAVSPIGLLTDRRKPGIVRTPVNKERKE
ncbi:MAG: DHA2 family efflux MFS transporter permease subunit [Sporolactobacillus sp.]